MTTTQTQVITENPGSINVKKLSGTVMSVGGGVEDDAVDVTYSTKPENKINSIGTQKLTTRTSQHSFVVGQGTIEGVYDENVMGVDRRVGDEAADVTYSTKPDINNMELSSQTNISGLNTVGQTSRIISQGSIMGVGGGVGDEAVDVTYSTKPDNNIKFASRTFTSTATTTNVTQNLEGAAISSNSTIMSVGGGVEDEAVDVTYSTKPDNNTRLGNEQIARLATTTTSITGEDISNLQVYNRATILQDKVQHIIQKEIQPIIKTVIKPIIQKEIQPIVQREIQPIIQHEIQPVVEKEIQPVIQRDIQPIVKREIQPIIQKKFNL